MQSKTPESNAGSAIRTGQASAILANQVVRVVERVDRPGTEGGSGVTAGAGIPVQEALRDTPAAFGNEWSREGGDAPGQGVSENDSRPQEAAAPTGVKNADLGQAQAQEVPLPESFVDVADLGKHLRLTREKRGMDLKSVSDVLKLSVPTLQALEEGNFSIFQHKAYAKGFLRSYVRFLKIPETACRGIFAALTPVQEFNASIYTPDKSARPRFNKPWLGVLASLCIACLIAFGIWYFDLVDLVIRETSTEPQTVAPMPSSASPTVDRQMREREEDLARKRAQEQSQAQEEAQSRIQAGPVAAGTAVDSGTQGGAWQGSWNMGTPAQASPDMPQGGGSAVSEGSPLKSLSLVDAGERKPLPAVVMPESPWSTLQGNATIAGEAGLAEPEPEPATGSEAGEVLPASGRNTVVVVAEATCWTSIVVDSGRAEQRTLQAGETLSLDFENSLRLRLGNAGGVRVFYNGREIEQGRPGQVRNLNFPMEQDGAVQHP